MSYKSKKSSKQDFSDRDNGHHVAKRRKSFANTKHYRILDNVLRTKDASKILMLEEKY